jgi:hypothetical protein
MQNRFPGSHLIFIRMISAVADLLIQFFCLNQFESSCICVALLLELPDPGIDEPVSKLGRFLRAKEYDTNAATQMLEAERVLVHRSLILVVLPFFFFFL